MYWTIKKVMVVHGLATVLSRADTTVNYALPCDFIGAKLETN
jgi:hypothetical protein